MQILQTVPIILLFLVFAADVIIGIFFDPPFILTKMVLIILSIFGVGQNISLVILGTALWWIATLGGFGVVLALAKKPLFSTIAAGIIGGSLWIFGKLSPFGAAAIALAYPKFIYFTFEVFIMLPFVAIAIFLLKE